MTREMPEVCRYGGGEVMFVNALPPEPYRVAMCDWLTKHGFDYREVAVGAGSIVRDELHRQVRAVVYSLNADGRPYLDPDTEDPACHVEVRQLEARPLPFPTPTEEDE